MKNVLEYLENTTENNKDKIAIVEENRRSSYLEVLQTSKKIGSELTKYVVPRSPVPILAEKGIDALYSFFGAVYAGCFYILLNPELPVSRLERILEVLDTKVLLTDNEHIELAKQIGVNHQILKISDLKEKEINEERLNQIREQALDVDPLYANFTSGSTGTPKGVVISHRSVIDFIDIFTQKFNITEKDIIGNQAPFDFDVSVKDIYSCLKTGATLVVIPKRLFSLPAKLLDYISDNNVTTLIWAVSALCLITTFHGLEYKVPEAVNKVLFSGEIMPIKHLREWIKYLPKAEFVNVYGPTEITCNCTYHIIDKNLNYEKQIPIGKAFDNEQVFLLDETDNIIKEVGKSGEICVKGTALGLGYYNDMKQTNDRFVQNPQNTKYRDLIYKTGDMGYYGENDELYFSGRKDFQIKHLGHRVELEEIETAIGKIEEIERACCIYIEEKSKIYGFYIGKISKMQLRDTLKQSLPIYMIPNVLMEVDEMPITKNGKIYRKKLKALIMES